MKEQQALQAVIKRVAHEQDVMTALEEIFRAGRQFERERIIYELERSGSEHRRKGALSRYLDGEI